MRYRCDQCGACCRNMIIDVSFVDALREPRIAEVCDPLKDVDGYIMACGPTHPCPFDVPNRQGGSACSIYPTRPHVCVVFQPGSKRCQERRNDSGLPPLPQVEGDDPLQAVMIETEDGEE